MYILSSSYFIIIIIMILYTIITCFFKLFIIQNESRNQAVGKGVWGEFRPLYPKTLLKYPAKPDLKSSSLSGGRKNKLLPREFKEYLRFALRKISALGIICPMKIRPIINKEPLKKS